MSGTLRHRSHVMGQTTNQAFPNQVFNIPWRVRKGSGEACDEAGWLGIMCAMHSDICGLSSPLHQREAENNRERVRFTSFL